MYDIKHLVGNANGHKKIKKNLLPGLNANSK